MGVSVDYRALTMREQTGRVVLPLSRVGKGGQGVRSKCAYAVVTAPRDAEETTLAYFAITPVE